jgi:hypothetical protein
MEMGGSSFGEILSTALPSCNTADQSDSQSDHSSNSGEASHTLPWVSFIWIRIWIANPDPGKSISNAQKCYSDEI